MILSWEDILKVRGPVGRAQGFDERPDITMDVSEKVLAGADILYAVEKANLRDKTGKGIGERLLEMLDFTSKEMTLANALYRDKSVPSLYIDYKFQEMYE